MSATRFHKADVNQTPQGHFYLGVNFIHGADMLRAVIMLRAHAGCQEVADSLRKLADHLDVVEQAKPVAQPCAFSTGFSVPEDLTFHSK